MTKGNFYQSTELCDFKSDISYSFQNIIMKQTFVMLTNDYNCPAGTARPPTRTTLSAGATLTCGACMSSSAYSA